MSRLEVYPEIKKKLVEFWGYGMGCGNTEQAMVYNTAGFMGRFGAFAPKWTMKSQLGIKFFDMEFIVELEEGVYLATWSGDPGRTLKIENAQVFVRDKDADNALVRARYYRPFKYAKVRRQKEGLRSS